MLGIITGSGLEELEGLQNRRSESLLTPFGEAPATFGTLGEVHVVTIGRHGRDHRLLPNVINHRANIFALREVGCRAIIATSVVGVTNPTIPLARVLLFDDLFFLDNRLPDGQPCSIFEKPGTKGKGHLIFDEPFSKPIRDMLWECTRELGIEPVIGGVYGHVNGPRFNSRSEVAFLRSVGVEAISQTCGPEAILAAECEIPYQLVGFGVDYANGVSETPTPVDLLDRNLSLAREILPQVLSLAADRIDLDSITFNGFIYRI